MTQNGTLQKSILLILIIVSATGCGQKAVNSAGLTIAVSPAASYILPGTASNCGDYQTFKAALSTATTTVPTLSTSISQLRVSFPRFQLTWSNDTLLYIAYLQFTITSPQFNGGIFTYNVAGAELSALLGNATNTFAGQKSMFNSTDLIKDANSYGTIFSNDIGRDCSTGGKSLVTGETCTYQAKVTNKNYAACGLQIGGISLTNTKASAFTAPFTLKLIGYSMDANYNQTPLQTTASGTVTFNGIQ